MTLDTDAVIAAFFFILKALPNTLLIPAVTMLLGIVFGTVIAVARLHSWRGSRIFRPLLILWVSFVRAVPAIVQIFIMYYSLPYLLAPVLGFFAGHEIKPYEVSPYWTAYLFFTVYQTAYQSENIRGALLAVDKGQYEAAVSVGLSPLTAYRRIILPQAFVVAMPSFFTYYLHGIKGLALVFTIRVVDIFAAADIFAALYSRRTEPYLADALLYWLLCLALTWCFNKWEDTLRSKGLARRI